MRCQAPSTPFDTTQGAQGRRPWASQRSRSGPPVSCTLEPFSWKRLAGPATTVIPRSSRLAAQHHGSVEPSSGQGAHESFEEIRGKVTAARDGRRGGTLRRLQRAGVPGGQQQCAAMAVDTGAVRHRARGADGKAAGVTGGGTRARARSHPTEAPGRQEPRPAPPRGGPER